MLTKYNGYEIRAVDLRPGRKPLFSAEELEELQKVDAQIESDFAIALADSMRGYKNPETPPTTSTKKRYDKPLTEAQRARKRERDRAYHAAHRYEINVRSRQWEKDHPEIGRARSLAYYEAHREELLEKARARRAARKGVKSCSPPPSATRELLG